MDRVIFEEKQGLPGAIGWVAFIVGLGCCFPVLRGVYLRMVLHEPWGDPALGNAEALLLLIFLVTTVGGIVWLVSNIYLEVIIDQAGVSYRYFPHHRKYQRIGKEMIASYTTRMLRWHEVARKRSKRLGWPNGDLRFSIRGRKVLELTLTGGKKVALGTQDTESVNWAMGKLMSNR